MTKLSPNSPFHIHIPEKYKMCAFHTSYPLPEKSRKVPQLDNEKGRLSQAIYIPEHTIIQLTDNWIFNETVLEFIIF